MPRIPITFVRTTAELARRELDAFLFGGLFASPRPPRGIAPELVGPYLMQRMTPKEEWHTFARALDLMRFYECADPVGFFLSMLHERESTLDDVLRAAMILQMAGDLGSEDQAATGARYFDNLVMRAPSPPFGFPPLIDTLVVLAPAAEPVSLAAPLDRAIEEAARHETDSPEAAMAYDRVLAIRENDFARALSQRREKIRLLTMPTGNRRAALIRIYLGQSPFSDPYLQVWAARLLRREAMDVDPQPLREEFARAIDRAASRSRGDVGDRFVIARAAQAILYLLGRLSPEHRRLYEAIADPPISFLWDELPPAFVEQFAESLSSA